MKPPLVLAFGLALLVFISGPDLASAADAAPDLKNADTLSARTIRAHELEAQGKALEAEQELRAILAVQEKEPGAEANAAIWQNYHTLASCLKARNQTQEALTYASRALTGRLKLLGKDANDTDASQRLVNQLTYASPPGPELQALPSKTRPVAMVDGALIYATEVQQTITAQQEVIRYQYRNDSDKMEEELAKLSSTPFGGLIDKHLLLNEFRRLGGVIKQEYIDDDLNTIIKDSFKGDRDLFIADLSKSSMTLEEFRTLREHMAIMHAMRSRFTGVVTLTDEEVRDYFEKNKQRWLAPEQIKIRTLSIPKTQTDARETAESLRKKILGGADFAETARASSQDSHAEDGGAWDWITLSDLSDHVRKAAAKTPKGQLGELIEQENTFIILRVDDRRAPPPPPFEKVKAEVTQALETEVAQQRNAASLKELRDKADIRKLGAL